MAWHPLSLVIGLMEVITWVVYIGAAWRLMILIPQWQPESCDEKQLWRQRALEMSTFQGRWTLFLQITTFILFMVGLTNAWYPYIPGAVCGAGVLEAMGSSGYQALLFRALSLIILYCWYVMQRVMRHHPQKTAAIFHGRLLLLAAPLMVMATWSFGRAVMGADSEAAVNCCTVVYNQALSSQTPLVQSPAMGSGRTWMLSMFSGAFLLSAGGIWLWRSRVWDGKRRLFCIVGLCLMWSIGADLGLKWGVGPHIYQSASNPCIWCLFLPANKGLGFVLFGLVAIAVVEGLAAATLLIIGARAGLSMELLYQRISTSGRRIFIVTALFISITATIVMV